MWGACRLSMPEGGHTQGTTLGAHLYPPRPPPPPPRKAHAAEFCRHEAKSRAEPEQQSGQDIFSAREHECVGGWGRGSHPTAPCGSIPHPCFSSPKNLGGKKKNHSVGELLEGLGLPERRVSCSMGARPSIPRRLPPFSSSLCSRSPGSATRPRAGALRAEAARAAVRGRRRQEGGVRRGGGSGGGRCAPTQAAREGILGVGPAPSRARGAGPRATRVTGRPPPAARFPRVGGRRRRRAGLGRL